jgi:hypothetical protein
MKLQVSIESDDSSTIAKDLFGKVDSRSLERGKTEKIVTDGVTLRFDGIKWTLCASVGSSPSAVFLEIAVEFGKQVVLPIAVTVLSSYIYDKLKDRKTESITIGNTIIKIENMQINQQIIYQTIINEASQQKDENAKT